MSDWVSGLPDPFEDAPRERDAYEAGIIEEQRRASLATERLNVALEWIAAAPNGSGVMMKRVATDALGR